MSGAPAYVAAFEQVRPAVLARLVEVRGSVDDAFARLSDAQARGLFDGVLLSLRTLLVTGDHALHRGFVQSFIALRGAEGLAPDHAQRALVAIGDVAIQVAGRERPGDTLLVHAIIGTLRVSARMVNDVLAEELGRRSAQRRATEAWR